MMATTAGGSYVLQPQVVTTGNNAIVSTTAACVSQGQTLSAMRTLQGIKVFPVQSTHRPGTLLTSHGVPTSTVASHQLVARIISGRPGMQPAQIMIPNAGFQPVIVAQNSQMTNSVPVSMPVVQPASQIAISVQPQQKVSQSHVTVTLPVQKRQ